MLVEEKEASVERRDESERQERNESRGVFGKKNGQRGGERRGRG